MKLFLIAILFCFSSCNGQELTGTGPTPINVYTKATIDSINAVTQSTLNAQRDSIRNLSTALNNVNLMVGSLNIALASIQPLRDSINALKSTVQPIRDSLNALKVTVAAIKPVYFQGFVGDGLTPSTPIMPPPCPCKQ